jgi:crossover junction endodeoxyribonuclease RuvC
VERVGGTLAAVEIGVIKTPADRPPAARLAYLRASAAALVDRLDPEVVAVERIFFNANVRTAMSVGQASGALLSLAGERGLDVIDYTPTQVKQAVTGFGAATKAQVQAMVARLLGLKEAPKSPDAADACALCICHINRSRLARAVEASA